MTNEELLQQAKDQVADEMAGCTWAKIEERFPEALSTHNFMMMHHAAAIRAIQSAREEAKKAIEDLGTIGHDPKNPMWDALPDSAEAVNAAYANAWNKFRELAIEKLTAPGR